MKTRLPVFLLAVLAIAPWIAHMQPVQAQDGDASWYLRPRVGVSYYWGDNDKEPNVAVGDNFDVFPYNAGLEIGYNFKPTYSVGLWVSGSAYGSINDFDRLTGGQEVNYSNDEDRTKINVALVARHRYGSGKIAPYVEEGLGVSFGKTSTFPTVDTDNVATPGMDESFIPGPTSSEVAFGPLLGFGIDVMLSDRVTLALGTGGSYVFGDDKADGTDNDANFKGRTGGFGPGDWLGHNTLAFKFNLKVFKPVYVTDLVCPADVVLTGEPTTFTASVNEDATQPMTASWAFGDGATASGLTATHTFTRAGTYNVSFTATNGDGRATDTQTCTVTAEDPVIAPTIVSMSANPMSPDTESNVAFSADVQGTAPFTYRWDFGDGSTSTEANPGHQFTEPGTYEVSLEVCNEAGCDTRVMTVVVAPYEAAICREITEMNSVFFSRNSSTITEEGRALLQENLEILAECPNLNARIEGWAAPGERRPQDLSAARARAVEQFYVDNGIAASRLVTVGMGRAQGMTSKKEGLSQFRRVDTIPVRN